MNRKLIAARRHLAPVDAVLFAAGVIGLVMYFVLMPSQHPDSAASFRLGEERAVKIARTFLQHHSLAPPEEARLEVALERDEGLLDSLQRELGRPRTVQLLKTEARVRLPAYYWRVAWEKEREDEEDLVFEVRLTLGGEIYDFQADRPQAVSLPVNREALVYVLPTDTLTAPDSVLVRRLAFALTPSAREKQADRALRLDRAAVVRLARYHLQQTALAPYTFRADTVWTEQRAGVQAATVRFQGGAFYGQRPRVEATVTAAGALLALDTDFGPEEETPVEAPGPGTEVSGEQAAAGTSPEAEETGFNIDIESGTVAGLISGLLYVLLGLAAFFFFFRRVSARLLDMQSALRDALWGGLFAAVWFSMPALYGMQQEAGMNSWMIIVALSFIVVFAGGGGAFLIFIASGAMDSVARAKWPEKLTALSLLRHGALRNVPVGAALARGLAVAFVLLGGTTLLLMLLPGAAIDFSEMGFTLGSEDLLSPFAYFFAAGGWVGLFVGLTVMLGVGTFLYRWKPSAWVVVPGLMIVLTLLQCCHLPVRPLGWDVVFTAFVALVLAWTFWHYEFITFFTAYLFADVIMNTTSGWMIGGVPLALDATLAFMAVGVVLVVAFIGLFSGKTSTEVPDYVPAYIHELAEEERLKRDIEIAQEVQRSFLPRRMPRVEGLDVAALCLPAREVGGDYYDFIELAPGRLAVIIGDVSGKGIEAAFYMTLAKGFLQTLACEEAAPVEVMHRLNMLFCRNVPRGIFLSLIYGVMDVRAGTFTFARAGHNPLILRSTKEARPRFLQPGGMALGLTPDTRFRAAMEEQRLHLREGDTLVLYTDGFSEAMNTRGEQFGDERLARAVATATEKHSAHEILRTVSERVHHHVEGAGRHDDMTMVVVRLAGPTRYVEAVQSDEQAVASLVGS